MRASSPSRCFGKRHQRRVAALFFLAPAHFSQSGGSAHDDTRPARLVRRPQRPERPALLGRPRLDTASSAEDSLAIRASFRCPDAVATGAASAESASTAEPESASTAEPESASAAAAEPAAAADATGAPLASAEPASAAEPESAAPARRLLLRSGAVASSVFATS
jgi:hypothetical protein